MIDPSTNFALGVFCKRDEPAFLAFVRGDRLLPLAVLDPVTFPQTATLRGLLETWPTNFNRLSDLAAHIADHPALAPVADYQTCAPLPDPRQIFCTGANYRRHVVEMVVAVGLGAETAGMDADERKLYGEAYAERQLLESEPYIFMKPMTSVAGPFDDLPLPPYSDQLDWELELGAVIGREACEVSLEDALSYVAGYMIVNDLTARDRVRRTDAGAFGPDWVAGKGGKGFLPSGPYFVPAQFVQNPQNLAMRLAVSGEIMQDSNTSDMTFDVARQVWFLSRHTRLLPGDILCTGSPDGNGAARGRFLTAGDVMVAEIEGLGRQVVHCVGR